ncbi:MAG: toprim domain-containing protein [Thermodesulfovibrionales bacterium]
MLDALAGEIILDDDKITLCSTNGICNIERIEKLLEQYKSEEVSFALDNDEQGQKAQEKGIEIAKPFSKIHIVDDHIKAGVKDLHKLLC